MKALIRYKDGIPNEVITEDMKIPGIDWTTGYPLTSPDWAGGPYTLIQNYIPPQPEEDPTPSLEASYTEETTQTSPTQTSQTVTLTAEEVEALRTALNTLGK